MTNETPSAAFPTQPTTNSKSQKISPLCGGCFLKKHGHIPPSPTFLL